MSTHLDRFVLTVAPFLGAKLFKRYWPGKGSYWNTSHFDKNSSLQLQGVIANSRENCSVHLRGLVSLGIVSLVIDLAPRFIQGLESLLPNLKLALLLLAVQALLSLYALMIQRYNIALAQARLRYLQQHKEEEDPILGHDGPIKIYSESFDGMVWYYLYGFGKRLSRDFVREETAIELRKYLYKKYPEYGLLSASVFHWDGYMHSYDAWVTKKGY